MGHKNVLNIILLSHCLEQLYSCIFNSYVKAYLNIWWRPMYGLKLFLFTSCRCVYRCVRDDWQLCLVRVNSLITRLQLKKMSVIYQSAHVTITFQVLEMSSFTTPNQTISNIHTRYKFFKEKNQRFLPICIMKKSNLEVPCKLNRFGYWNSCKRLPNFVNVAALLLTL